MTTLTRDSNGKVTEIPSDVTTVEQLLAWCTTVLEFNVGSLSYPETIAGNEYLKENLGGGPAGDWPVKKSAQVGDRVVI